MWNYLRSLPTSIQGFVVGVFISFVTNALISLLKDFTLPIYFDWRKNRKQKIDVFKNYKNPLTSSALSLCFRLSEIFSGRGNFLLASSPKNTFNNYQYLSTIYRLCSLIGWIRASKLEWSYYEINSSDYGYKNIEEVTFAFEKCLSSGEDIELLRVERLAAIWNIDITPMGKTQKKKLGIEIDDLIHQYVFTHKVKLASELPTLNQTQLMTQINNLISFATNSNPLQQNILIVTLNQSVQEISRIEAYIYKDWFNSIGDFMINSTEKGNRKYDVIGFGEFENRCLNGTEEQRRWLVRLDSFFWNMDSNNLYDARVGQFKKLFRATIDVIECFNIQEGHDILPPQYAELKLQAYSLSPKQANNRKKSPWLPSWWF